MCVTVARAPSPPISVRSSTPLVQYVNNVFGETLNHIKYALITSSHVRIKYLSVLMVSGALI